MNSDIEHTPVFKSFRWIDKSKFKVDAYATRDSQWFLFVQIRDPSVSWIDLKEDLQKNFDRGEIVRISGTQKLKNNSRPLSESPDPPLWTLERNLSFRLETQGVLNPGLFLDQALNRLCLSQQIQAAVKNIPNEKLSCLNLFSYTGSFSVTAAAAGIHQIVSVDTSDRYLKWERLNHQANQHLYRSDLSIQLIKEDAQHYLKRCREKKKKFHWIILDPPTFSRSGKKVFQVQKNLPAMIQHAIGCLETKGGGVLVSVNDQQWFADEFFGLLKKEARQHHLKFTLGKTSESIGTLQELKSAWLLRPSLT